MRLNQDGARSSGMVLHKSKVTQTKLAIAATLALTDDFPTAMDIDPATTSQKILMPAPTIANEGLYFYINNLGTGAGTLVLRDSGDTVTYATLPISKLSMVVNLNGTWRAMVSA